MDDKQFNEICTRLDKIYGIIAAQTVDSIDDKVYLLRKLGFKSSEIGPIVGLKNVRVMEGWKRK